MDCPQCGAEVPSDNAFCGKCGYAMRDDGPDRTDQSRIRLHEEPTPTHEERRPSSPRIRKRTVLGMPPVEREGGPPAVSEPPPPPPAALSPARSTRRTPQKTMLGIPRPDLPDPAVLGTAAPSEPEAPEVGDAHPEAERPRAHVRYDSVLEPPPVTMRRRKVFAGVAVLVALSAGWLIYRFLNG